MPKSPLTKLRQARIRCRKAILNTERLLASYQDKLSGLDAAIREIAPELDLTYYRRNPNSYFKYRELPRLTLEVMKAAGEPLPSRVIVVRVLAMKGEELPSPTLRQFTQHRLSAVLSAMQTRGLVVMTGNKRCARWGLV